VIDSEMTGHGAHHANGQRQQLPGPNLPEVGA
jgi:hypothetical protein